LSNSSASSGVCFKFAAFRTGVPDKPSPHNAPACLPLHGFNQRPGYLRKRREAVAATTASAESSKLDFLAS